MGSEIKGLYLIFHLIGYPRLNDIGSKYITFQEIIMILFQGFELNADVFVAAGFSVGAGFSKLESEDAIDPENPVGESFSEKLTGRLRRMRRHNLRMHKHRHTRNLHLRMRNCVRKISKAAVGGWSIW